MFSERIDFSHEATLTIDELIKRVEVLLPDTDLAILRKCYEFAEKMHINHKRSSGEPYIIHPLNVAATLVKLKMDLDSIMAGLLHDVVEAPSRRASPQSLRRSSISSTMWREQEF